MRNSLHHESIEALPDPLGPSIAMNSPGSISVTHVVADPAGTGDEFVTLAAYGGESA